MEQQGLTLWSLGRTDMQVKPESQEVAVMCSQLLYGPTERSACSALPGTHTGSFPQPDTGPPAASGLCGWVSKGGDGGQTHPHSVSLRGGRQALSHPTPAFPSQVITKDQPHFPLKGHSLSCQPDSLLLQALLPAHIPARCVPGQNCVS